MTPEIEASAGAYTAANPWTVEFTTTDGRYGRMLGYPSKEAGEAAKPRVLKEQGGYNGHCIRAMRDGFRDS
jgi:hypothetical protein